MVNLKGKWVFLLVVLSIMILMVGCMRAEVPVEPDDPDEPGAEDPVDDPQPTKSKVVVGQNFTGTVSWDPPQDWHSAEEWTIENAYDYLFYRCPENKEWVPELAYKWERIDDLTVRFWLEEGVKFHDGTDFTAADVKSHYRRIIEGPRELYIVSHQYDYIDKMIIHDDYTIDFVSKEPTTLFFWRLTQQNNGAGIVSKAYYEEVGAEGIHRWPMGTGPWKLDSWARDEFILFERNEDYWQTDKMPNYDWLEFRIIPEMSTRVAELLTGGLDLTFDISPEDEARVANAPGIQSLWQKAVAGYIMRIRTERDPQFAGDPQLDRYFLTEDWRIRKAVELAIDKYGLRDIAGGEGEPMRVRNLRPASWASPKLYGPEANLYDPEAARALIAEAGYAPGEATLVFHAGVRPDLCPDIAEVVKQMLEEVGFTVDMRILAGPLLNTEVYNPGKSEELLLYPIGGNHNPFFATMAYLSDRATLRGGMGLVNEETLPEELKNYHERVDSLLNTAYTAVDDEQKSINAYHEALELVADARARELGLFQLSTLWGISDDIEYTPRFDNDIWGYDIKVVR